MPKPTKPHMPHSASRSTRSSTEEVQSPGTVRQARSVPRVSEPLDPFPRNPSETTTREPDVIKPFSRSAEAPEQASPRLMARPYTKTAPQRVEVPDDRKRPVAQPYQHQKRQDHRVLRRFADDSPMGWFRFCAQQVALVIHPLFAATIFVVNIALQIFWGFVEMVAPYLSNDSQRRIRRMSGPMLHQDSPAAMIIFAALLLFGVGFATKPFLLTEGSDPRSFEYTERPAWQRIADPERAVNWLKNAADAIADIAAPAQPNQTAPLQPLAQRAPGDHNLQGTPSISPQQIDRILESYGSPATGTGQAWYDLGLKYNIDPAYAVAFFIHESSAGTNPAWAGWKDYGSQASTHNVGNIICAGYSTCFGRFRDYPSWEAGIDDWYRLISVEYIQGRGTVTVAQIIPIYAPSFENNVDAYVGAVENMVDTWRTQGVQ